MPDRSRRPRYPRYLGTSRDLATANHSANHRSLTSSMRVLLQRVSRAEVRVREGGAVRTAGRIDRGFVLLVGFTHDDDEARVVWMAEKVVGLRLFADSGDKMNLGLADVGGSMLVVSQFTLYGDAAKGRRPRRASSRTEAAESGRAAAPQACVKNARWRLATLPIVAASPGPNGST